MWLERTSYASSLVDVKPQFDLNGRVCNFVFFVWGGVESSFSCSEKSHSEKYLICHELMINVCKNKKGN